MKTHQDIRDLTAKLVNALPADLVQPFLRGVNDACGTSQITQCSEHQIPFVMSQLEAFAQMNGADLGTTAQSGMKKKILKIVSSLPNATVKEIHAHLCNGYAHPENAPSRSTVSKCVTRLVKAKQLTRVLHQRRDGKLIYQSYQSTSVPDASASVAANS